MCLFVKNELNKISKVQFFIVIFLFAFCFFSSLLFWIKDPFFIYEETKNIILISLVFIIFLSLVFTLIFMLVSYYNILIPVFFLIPIIFLIFELVVSSLIYGFPWITFSLIGSNNFLFLIIVKYLGSFLTSYIIIQIYCIPYILINKLTRKSTIVFLSLLFIPIIIIYIYEISNSNKYNYNQTSLKFEIVQLNKPIIQSVIDKDKTLKEMIEIILKSNSDIIVFAENNYPFVVDTNLSKIQKIVKENQNIIMGVTRKNKNEFYNTLAQISKSEIIYFDKKILVPFGEFLPFRNLLSFFEPISGQNDFSIGKKKRIIEISEKVKYIPIICYEIIFYWKLLSEINYDSDFIINITNDLWFGKYFGPYQHLYLAKLRAAEFNKTILRSSNNGISAIINERGKFILSSNLNEKIILKSFTKIINNKNFYKNHNYLNKYFLIILAILFFINLIYYYGKKKSKF